MNSKFFAFGVICLSTTAAFAQSVPTKSPDCSSKARVIAPRNGSGVFFDASCKTAYVLPPVEGDVSLSSIAPSGNLMECGALDLRRTTVERIARKIDQLWSELDTMKQPPGAPEAAFGSGPFSEQEASSESGELEGEIEKMKFVEEKTRELDKLKKSLREILADYAKVEGATAQLNFKIGMSELIQSYQSLNQSIRFERMPLEIARMSFASRSGTEAAQMPAVLSVKVPGLDSLQVGNEELDPKGERIEKTTGDESIRSPIFGDALSGQIRLSLPGACPFYNKSRKKMVAELSGRDLAAYVDANVQYSYFLQAFRKYKASYNLASLVKRIQKQSTSGGWFTTKSANSLIIEKDSSDWFILKPESDDARFQYEDIAKELKSDLIDRVLKQITYAQVGPQSTDVDPAAPKANGVSTAASGLRNNCFHWYCQAGAAVLDVLNSAFGGTQASSTFINQNDFWANDDVSEKRMLRFYGSFTFGK